LAKVGFRAQNITGRMRTDVVADISAGVARCPSVKLFYDGRLGETIQENAAGAKATVPF